MKVHFQYSSNNKTIIIRKKIFKIRKICVTLQIFDYLLNL